jgi:DNA-binding transcriptional ArsR family regulator
MPDPVDPVVLLSALADPTRLRVVRLLAGGQELHVGAIAEALALPMATVSHHLGILREAGVLADRKDGRQVFYGPAPGVFTPASGDRPAELHADGVRVLLDGR